MDQPTQQHIYIYDDPESRIHFLETTLGDQEWMASIVVPKAQAADPHGYVDTLEHELRDKGYVTSRTAEADDTVSLHVHHFSSHSDPADAFAEMGLTKGAAFTVRNAGPNFHKLVKSAMDLGLYLVKEPARLFSTIYLVGDSSYSLSGFFGPKEAEPFWKRIAKPENALSSLSGALAFAQSASTMKYANNGGELNYSELKNRFKSGERQGIDAVNVKGWTAPGMERRWFGPVGDMARKYPIDTGSWAQISGQGALMLSSGIVIGKGLKNVSDVPLLAKDATFGKILNNARHISPKEWWEALGEKRANVLESNPAIGSRKQVLGSGINILRACVSITAWHMLMQPAKEGTVDASWIHPVDRIRQEIDIHPERAAGLINFGASCIGLTASHIKGNRAGLFAESMWLLGDVVMMFAKRGHYGEAAAQREIPLIDAATRFLQEMPVAVSEARKQAIIADLSHYLAQKTIDEQTDTKRARTAPITEEIDTLKQAIMHGVNANLSMINTIFDRMTSATSVLLESFPPEQREFVFAKLVHGMASAPGVYATEEEIATAVRAHTDMTGRFGMDTPGVGVLSRSIAQIITESPPIAKAGIANAIYDAIIPITKFGPGERIVLNRAIEQAATAQLLSPAEPVVQSHASRVKAPAGESHVTRISAPSGTAVSVA